MKTKPHFATVFQRRSVVKEFVFDLFFSLSSWPRLLLEVFVRTKFGARYFSFTHVVFVFILLVLGPILIVYGPWNYYTPQVSDFLLSYWSWYLFSIAFLLAGWQQRKEVEAIKYKFIRFTFTTGRIHPFFESLRLNGQLLDYRTIETIVEPAFFFTIGLLLCLTKQPIGFIIVPCSIIYGLSYAAAYSYGDDRLFDVSDKWITREQIPNFLLNETGQKETRGFRYYGTRPADPEFAKKVADDFFEDEEVVDAL